MAANDPVEVRIEKMATWAAGVEAQLKELSARILPTADECDALSAKLGALYEKYAPLRDGIHHGPREVARETRNILGEIEDELRRINAKDAPLAVMEAQASLDAFGINEVTSKPYTVKQTSDRAKVALGANDDYTAITARRRKLEGDQARGKAVLTDCDAALSEYRNRNRALVARLDNLTAQLGK